MAKVTPILWKHKSTAEGLFPIWLRVADAYRTLYYSTGEAIKAGDWNPNAKCVRKSHPVADDLNALIQDRLATAQAERVRPTAAFYKVLPGTLTTPPHERGPRRL